MSIQNLYLSWGEILSPNCKASWSYTHSRHTQGQCLDMCRDQAASYAWWGKHGFKVLPRHGRKGSPQCNLFCPKAIKTSFFFFYNLQEFPLAGLPLVLSASETFPPWHHPSAFTCFLRRSSPQNTLPLPSSFPFPCFQLFPRAKAAESLSKHTRDMKCLLSALFSPKGICKETRINTENNSSQTAGLVFFLNHINFHFHPMYSSSQYLLLTQNLKLSLNKNEQKYQETT